MGQKYITSTLICVRTSNEKVLELVDYYTLKGQIILLTCINILDDINQEADKYLKMDKEKINISDRIIIHGELLSSDKYVKELIEYGEGLGKDILYIN